MERQSKEPEISVQRETIDLSYLLHPADAFAHPMDVVRDADLTLNEKRAILASWASDACAIEAAPELRMTAAGDTVRWDEIMDALRLLDREAAGYGRPPPHYKRVLAVKRGERPGALGQPPELGKSSHH